jgi:hypothetical protein
VHITYPLGEVHRDRLCHYVRRHPDRNDTQRRSIAEATTIGLGIGSGTSRLPSRAAQTINILCMRKDTLRGICAYHRGECRAESISGLTSSRQSAALGCSRLGERSTKADGGPLDAPWVISAFSQHRPARNWRDAAASGGLPLPCARSDDRAHSPRNAIDRMWHSIGSAATSTTAATAQSHRGTMFNVLITCIGLLMTSTRSRSGNLRLIKLINDRVFGACAFYLQTEDPSLGAAGPPPKFSQCA